MAKEDDGGLRQGTKRKMTKFTITEISGVDSPAQKPAKVAIMKRDGSDAGSAVVNKRAYLTTSVGGHAHLVDEYHYDGSYRDGGETSYSKGSDEDYGHTHPWVRNPDGSITIGEADGHTHEVIVTMTGGAEVVSEDGLVKQAEEYTRMTDKNTGDKNTGKNTGDKNTNGEAMTAEELKEKLANEQKAKKEMEEKNKKNEAKAKMNDAQKAHYATLDGDAADDFLFKSDSEQNAIIADFAKGDQVIYTSIDGDVFRKSDDPRMVRMAKAHDADRKELAKSRADAENSRIEKRATAEFGHLTGDATHVIALLKAVEGIKDEDVRKGVETILKAQAPDLSKATTEIGTSAAPEVISKSSTLTQAEDALEASAQAIMKRDNIPYLDAYEKAGTENKELLAKAMGR